MNFCTNFKSISSKIAEIWHKTCQKQTLFTSFREYTAFSEFYFLTDFDASKSVIRPFFAFFAKIWHKNMYHSSKSHFFVWPFIPETWDLRWPWPILWSQSIGNDTYKCQYKNTPVGRGLYIIPHGADKWFPWDRGCCWFSARDGVEGGKSNNNQGPKEIISA